MIYVFFDVLNFLIDIVVSNSSIIFLWIWDRVFRDSTSNSFVLKLITFFSILRTSLRLMRFCWFWVFFEVRRFSRVYTNVTKRGDSFAIFLSLMMSLSRVFNWTTQISLSISFALMIDTSRKNRRKSFRFLFWSWSWKVW